MPGPGLAAADVAQGCAHEVGHPAPRPPQPARLNTETTSPPGGGGRSRGRGEGRGEGAECGYGKAGFGGSLLSSPEDCR